VPDAGQDAEVLRALKVFLIVRCWQVVKQNGRGHGWCHLDVPIPAVGEAGNGVQVSTSNESAEQTRESLISFTNDSDVDAVDGTDQLGAHFAIEVSTAEYRHDVRVALFQAPSQCERRGVLLECRGEPYNRHFFPRKGADQRVQVCWNINAAYSEKLFSQLF
jgi:hypothetical protein